MELKWSEETKGFYEKGRECRFIRLISPLGIFEIQWDIDEDNEDYFPGYSILHNKKRIGIEEEIDSAKQFVKEILISAKIELNEISELVDTEEIPPKSTNKIRLKNNPAAFDFFRKMIKKRRNK